MEDITHEVLKHALAGGRYTPTAQTAEAFGFDVAVITVPTPLRDGAPDLSYVEEAAATLARFQRAWARADVGLRGSRF